MDWRNYQFWRKDIRRMENEATEFDVLIQRTVKRIAVQQKIERSIRMLQEQASNSSKKVSGWRDRLRNAYDTGKSLFFQKKL